MTNDVYLVAEARARVEIDSQLVACGWVVQGRAEMNLYTGQGVAVREFIMAPGHGRADYLLVIDGKAVGAVEAKTSGTALAGVEPQSAKYAAGLPKNLTALVSPLPFLYESTGDETMFTDGFDPEPRSRPVVTFHRPETLARWLRHWIDDADAGSLRARLQCLGPVGPEGLRRIQVEAINGVEASMVHNHPRALAQMATGSGKTFMAAKLAYRLVLTAGAERVLFLVDRANLGRQTLREFQQFATPGDGRKFTDLYNVQLLTSNRIDTAARVVITTVQRLYSMLRGEEELPEDVDEKSGPEIEPDRPVDVTYNPKIPIETFDVVIVDECHRSIYGVWRQVIEYFDAFLVGLTATPAKQTFGFFNQNLVVEYGHAEAVADGSTSTSTSIGSAPRSPSRARPSRPGWSPSSGSGRPARFASRSSTRTSSTTPSSFARRAPTMGISSSTVAAITASASGRAPSSRQASPRARELFPDLQGLPRLGQLSLGRSTRRFAFANAAFASPIGRRCVDGGAAPVRFSSPASRARRPSRRSKAPLSPSPVSRS